jgi:hypothetical protein
VYLALAFSFCVSNSRLMWVSLVVLTLSVNSTKISPYRCPYSSLSKSRVVTDYYRPHRTTHILVGHDLEPRRPLPLVVVAKPMGSAFGSL